MKLVRIAALGICLCTALGSRTSAHLLQNRGGVILGVVVDGATAKPIEGATVTLIGSTGMTVQSGEDGRFRISLGSPASGLRIRATAQGYLPGYKGQLGPRDQTGSSLDVASGQVVGDILIRLWPQGVISGIVTDERGAPVIKASVIALAPILVGGRRIWWRSSVPVTTNDLGEYRLERLTPNDYVIAVLPQPSLSNGMMREPAFNPGVRSVDAASPVSVNGGRQVVHVRLAAPTSARELTGQLEGADRSTSGMKVHITRFEPSGLVSGFERTTATTDSEGHFSFPSVADGVYRLQVSEFPRSLDTLFTVSGDVNRTLTGYLGPRPPSFPQLPPLPSDPTWVADQLVTVDATLSGPVTVRLQPGARIRGRVMFSGQRRPPGADELLTIPVVIRLADGGQSFDARANPMPQARIERDGSFASVGLPVGSYVIGVLPETAALQGWHLAQVQAGGRDLTGKPIDLNSLDVPDVLLTFVDRPTEITGTVSRQPGASVDPRVIVFPQNAADRTDFWAAPSPRRVLQGVPDASGTFRIPVPPGDYFVAGVISDLPALWMSPDYLQALVARAAKVTVRAGGQGKVIVAGVAVPIPR